MRDPGAEQRNREMIGGSEQVALREPAACGGRYVCRPLAQMVEGLAGRGGRALVHVAEIRLRPFDGTPFHGGDVRDHRRTPIGVVQPVDQQRAEGLEQEGLAAGSLENLLRDLGWNSVRGEAGIRLHEQPDRSWFIEERKLDLARADEMVVPYAVKLVEGRGPGDQQAHAFAMLNRGPEQAHQLEELLTAARKEILEAFEFVDGDEHAALVWKLVEPFEPRGRGLHGWAGRKWRRGGRVFARLVPECAHGRDRVRLEVEEDANGIGQHSGQHLEK